MTDAQGREIKGRITSIQPAALEVNAKGTRTLLAEDVRVVARQRRDSVKNGALWGGVGGCAGTYVVACAADREFCDDPETGYGFSPALFGFLGGMGVGAAVDGLIHGKEVVYRTPGAPGAPSSRFLLAPVIAPRTKGVAVSFSF